MSEALQAGESKPVGNLQQGVAGILEEAGLLGVETSEGEPKAGKEDLDEPEGEEPEGEEPEGEEPEGEEPEGEEPEGEEPESGGAEIQTLGELAEAIEVDPEFLYQLKIPMPSGEDPITLGEFKDRVAEISQVQSQRETLEREKTQLQQEKEQWGQQLQQTLQAPKEAQKLMGRLSSLEQAWRYLEDNKDSYQAGDLALKRQEIQNEYAGAAQELEQYRQKVMTEQQAKFHEQIQKSAQEVLTHIPEWKDKTEAKNGRDAMVAAVEEFGLTGADIDKIFDSRVIRLLHAFAKLKSGVNTAKATLRNVRPKPKVLKAGSAGAQSRHKKELSAKKRNQTLAAAAKETDLRKKASVVGQLLDGEL